jgi:putative zinc finger/helix-turn-helix YgiT family protein
MCGVKMKSATETNFHYAMSGLSKVYLNGVKIHTCTNAECGEEEVEIPNLVELHNLLAEITAKQENKLVPEEIRFLRTHLGYSGVDFARKLGVDAATVSRWENGKTSMGETAERLLRIMILAKETPIHDYELMDVMAQKVSLVAKRRVLRLSKEHWVEDKVA